VAVLAWSWPAGIEVEDLDVLGGIGSSEQHS
jgi:hypothetical protein